MVILVSNDVTLGLDEKQRSVCSDSDLSTLYNLGATMRICALILI